MANPNTESSPTPKAGPSIAISPEGSTAKKKSSIEKSAKDKGVPSQKTDLDQWQDLASGKTFALMYKGEIVFGREERDRKAWTAKLMPELAKPTNRKDAVHRVGAVGQSEAAELEQRAGLVQGAEASPLNDLDQCLADLSDNHRKLAEHTEKSIRNLWLQTKEFLAAQEAQIKEKERILDQLAMQNRTLKAEAKIEAKGSKQGTRG